MTMLIPFWVWLLLGIFIGWKSRGFFGKKLSFLGKVRRPFGPKKKKKPQSGQEEPEKEKTSVEKAKSAVDKVTGLLAKPWEKLLGDFKDEEEDDE